MQRFPGKKNPCRKKNAEGGNGQPLIKNKKSAQRGSFRAGYPADIRGSFAQISRPKTSVRALEILENKHLGADIHPRDLQKLRSEKLWAEFSFPTTLATPLAWNKCQNSRNAQKCFRRVLKVIWCPWAQSPKRVSRTVQTLSRTGGINSTFQENVFGLSLLRPENTFRTLLQHFWAF